MIAKYFWEAGSVIIGLMGLMHLRATLFTDKLFPRNETLKEDMKTSFPILSKKLTMWNGWIGFNATHSSAAIILGVINFYLAAKYFEMMLADQFFFLFSIITVSFYVWIAIKYWFNIIIILLSIVLSCYVISYILTIAAI